MDTTVTHDAVLVIATWMEPMDTIVKQSMEVVLASITLTEIIASNALADSSHILSAKLVNVTRLGRLTMIAMSRTDSASA